MYHGDPSSSTVSLQLSYSDNSPHDPLRTAVQPPLAMVNATEYTNGIFLQIQYLYLTSTHVQDIHPIAFKAFHTNDMQRNLTNTLTVR